VPGSPLRGVTVLVIDDHLDTLEVVERALEHAGARVIAAPSIDAGLRFRDREPVDLVLCDPAMLEAILARLRGRRDAERDAPVLAVRKPIAPETVIAQVAHLARRSERVAG